MAQLRSKCKCIKKYFITECQTRIDSSFNVLCVNVRTNFILAANSFVLNTRDKQEKEVYRVATVMSLHIQLTPEVCCRSPFLVNLRKAVQQTTLSLVECKVFL